MEKFKIKEVANFFGVCIDTNDYITNILTDSREVKENSLFVAIEGENFDGHEFINDAFSKGAIAVIARKHGKYSKSDRVIYVDDTRIAHIAIGKLYRDKFDIPIVAVTGSVGKTTTKEFIAAVLSSKYTTHKNPGNFNNEIGLPKTLFELTNAHQIAVLEMGMSGLGEIHNLTMAVRPNIAVITNIGLAHLEMLGSRENILKAKLEILDGMAHGTTLILWGDDNLLSGYHNHNFHIIKYGTVNPSCNVKAINVKGLPTGMQFDILSPWGEYHAKIPAIGIHNVNNALAAFIVGIKAGINPSEVADSLKYYRPSGMRQNMVEKNGTLYVEDCYNCSPDSLKAAILTLAGWEVHGRKIMVLSDMLELGSIAKQSHIELGVFIAKHGIDMLMATGELSINYIDGASKAGMERALYFLDKTSLASAIKSAVRKGDIVWIKASRGMQLEQLVEMLYEVN